MTSDATMHLIVLTSSGIRMNRGRSWPAVDVERQRVPGVAGLDHRPRHLLGIQRRQLDVRDLHRVRHDPPQFSLRACERR